MIPALDLDTVVWADLVEAARTAIGDSGGAWTLHAPVDPGITILEAFAARLEGLLYRLDRTDPAFVDNVLHLFGADPVRPTTGTYALLEASAPSGVIHLDRRSPVEALTADARTVLTTTSAIDIAPEAVIERVVSGAIDIGPSLGSVPSGAVRVLQAQGPDMIEFTVRMRIVPGSLAFAFLLDDRVDIESSFGWPEVDGTTGNSTPRVRRLSANTRNVSVLEPLQPLLDLTWSVAGQPVAVLDGTSGLRHSGIAVVTLPAGAPAEPDGFVRVTVRVAATRPEDIDPPRLRDVIVNAVVAEHRRTVTFSSTDPSIAPKLADLEWPGLPGFEIDVAHLLGRSHRTDDDARLIDDGSASMTLRERDGELHEWTSVRSLTGAGPGDRCFVIDRNSSTVRFGDGIHGRVPRRSEAAFELSLRVDLGGGRRERSLVGSRWTLGGAGGAAHATARRVIREGTDAESASIAAGRARREGRRRRVPVIVGDFEEVVRSADPELADTRVHVVRDYDPALAALVIPDSLSIVCVPNAWRPTGAEEQLIPAYDVPRPRLDTGRRLVVSDALQGSSRPMGMNVFLVDPVYRPVDVRIELRRRSNADTVARMRGALRRMLDALVGGIEGTGWPIGGALPVSTLRERAQIAAGAADEILRMELTLVSLNPRCASTSSDCDPVPLGRIELPYLNSVVVS